MKRLARVLCAVDIGEPGLAAFEQALDLREPTPQKLSASTRLHGTSFLIVEPRNESLICR